MNDIVVGVLGWMGLIGFTAWIYLFVKMLVKRELSIDNHTSDETESIEYKHTVMASDE